ncbi:hypothetical protein [Mesorhizobium ciceri]|nr:hypothetical protein [Mesorhizobium ciceri]
MAEKVCQAERLVIQAAQLILGTLVFGGVFTCIIGAAALIISGGRQ